jgi:hypothetical protein
MKLALLAVRCIRVGCDFEVAGMPKPMPPELWAPLLAPGGDLTPNCERKPPSLLFWVAHIYSNSFMRRSS